MNKILHLIVALSLAVVASIVFSSPAVAATKKFAVTNKSGHAFATSKGSISNKKSRDGFTKNSTISTGKYRFKFVRVGDGADVTGCLSKNTKYKFGSYVASHSGALRWIVAVKC